MVQYLHFRLLKFPLMGWANELQKITLDTPFSGPHHLLLNDDQCLTGGQPSDGQAIHSPTENNNRCESEMLIKRKSSLVSKKSIAL